MTRNAGLGRRQTGEIDKQRLHEGLASFTVGPSGRKRSGKLSKFKSSRWPPEQKETDDVVSIHRMLSLVSRS